MKNLRVIRVASPTNGRGKKKTSWSESRVTRETRRRVRIVNYNILKTELRRKEERVLLFSRELLE